MKKALYRVKLTETATPDMFLYEEKYNSLYQSLIGKTITIMSNGEALRNSWRFWTPIIKAELDSTSGKTHFRRKGGITNRLGQDCSGRLWINK